MEVWQKAWREALSRILSTPALEALQKALQADDSRLIQQATTMPPPLQSVIDWPVEGACAIGYCGWQGDGLETVGEVEEYFARVCFEVDNHFNEPAACRWFLNWFDETPRAQMIHQLLPEVCRTLEERRKQCA
jgi:hypothetical protein